MKLKTGRQDNTAGSSGGPALVNSPPLPQEIVAHVSDVANHQVGRITPLKTRGHAACSGIFGYGAK
nr:alpha-galactosidase [Paenibacillus thalictri]